MLQICITANSVEPLYINELVVIYSKLHISKHIIFKKSITESFQMYWTNVKCETFDIYSYLRYWVKSFYIWIGYCYISNFILCKAAKWDNQYLGISDKHHLYGLSHVLLTCSSYIITEFLYNYTLLKLNMNWIHLYFSIKT